MRRAFSAIEIGERPEKPRTTGISMLVDWGLPPGAQQDILDFSASFFDLAKIAVGISGLISKSALSTKILSYHESGVDPFPGGMFVELAYKQDKVSVYYEECRRVGYNLVEISDNVVHFSKEERQALIRQATDEYGLRVLGEVGSKHVETDPRTLVADIQDSLSAGAWKVFVEAAEFVTDDGFSTDLVRFLIDQVDVSKIIFELPGKWIPDVHAHQIYRMMVWLVDHVGADVNIGNLGVEDIVPLETLRTGVGVNMTI